MLIEKVYSDEIKAFVADGANTNGQKIEKLGILSRVNVRTIRAYNTAYAVSCSDAWLYSE